MTANTSSTENETIQGAVSWIRDRLPKSWEVGLSSRAEFQGTRDARVDAAIDLKGPNGVYTTMVVEVKRVFGPRDVDRLLGGVGRMLRTLVPHIPILVVAPWLSVRTREMLSDQGINFLDLTGNALIRLDNPTVYIQTQGAAKDPYPIQRNRAGLQGPKAGRLIRLLVDVRPPYGVRELAGSADLAPGYVSRLLDTLDSEALIERSARGRVESVDVGRVLRRWAQTYDVFRSNKTVRYLAPGGANDAVKKMASMSSRFAITGSFSAVRLAPVAGPALLVAYADSAQDVARTLDLIPTDQGANVALLDPFDRVVWNRTSTVDGLIYVAPSQTVVDCLTGNGRMPAEGDALLKWMTDNSDQWRLSSLPMPKPETKR
jgi:hypothetical protein